MRPHPAPRSRRSFVERLFLVFVVFGAALGAVGLACSGSDTGSIVTPVADGGNGLDTGTTPDPVDGASPKDGAAPVDAADAMPAQPLCEQTLDYALACGAKPTDLNCGGPDAFLVWCRQNDTAINSVAYRKAEAACLTKDRCKSAERKDCEYKTESSQPPTTAQKNLVAAYCARCEPGVAGCAAAHTTYDPSKGPNSTDDVFTAAWELADPLVDEIRTTCLMGDAGADAGSCLKAFAGCAADVYLNRVPECAK